MVYLFIYSSGSIPTSEMYVIYQCYEHLATLTIPPAPYCTRATSLNLWVSGKSGPGYGIGPGCKARLIMKQLEKYIFFRFLFMEEKIKGSWEKEQVKEEREEHETTTYWWLKYKRGKKSPLSQNPTSEFSVQQHPTQKRIRNGQEHVSWTWRSSRTGQG